MKRQRKRTLKVGMLEVANDCFQEGINCFHAETLVQTAFPFMPTDKAVKDRFVEDGVCKILNVMEAFSVLHECTCIPVTQYFFDHYDGNVKDIMSEEQAKLCVAGVVSHCKRSGRAVGFYVPDSKRDCLVIVWTKQQASSLKGSLVNKRRKAKRLAVQMGHERPVQLIEKAVKLIGSNNGHDATD